MAKPYVLNNIEEYKNKKNCTLHLFAIFFLHNAANLSPAAEQPYCIHWQAQNLIVDQAAHHITTIKTHAKS